MSAAASIRVGLGCALVVALGLGVGTARELQLGARACADSDAALARGDASAAVARARDAAESVAPGSPYPRRGYERLESIARAAEAHGDERGAVAAWSAMRAAAAASEGPLVAPGAWRSMAEEGLARWGSGAGGQTTASSYAAPDGEVRASRDAIAAALAADDVPPASLLALLGAGGFAFFAGAVRLAWAARDRGSLLRERAALAATALGAGLYLVACLRA